MIIVYTEQDTPRLRFILTQLLCRIAGTEFFITRDRMEYNASVLPGICYCNEFPGRGIWVQPSGLLEEDHWKPISPSYSFLEDGMGILFPSVTSSGRNFPFDLFSASFYLLTRYEEYFSKDLDGHGRYLPTSSILYLLNGLQIPWVELWFRLFQKRFLEMYPDYAFSCRKPRVEITHDIDHPFLYRNKGLFLSLYGMARDVRNGQFRAVKMRIKTLFHWSEDPYFNLIYLREIGMKNGFNPLFFIHAGPFGKFDRKTLYPSARYIKVLKKIAQGSTLGLHPSYCSDSKSELIAGEKKRLEKWIEKKVTKSRQHYLRFNFPETPRALLDAGIRHDYSLGYSEECGFRAGTSIPFPFFDLELNRETDLMLHPLVAMDVTLKREMSPEEAKRKILFLHAQCRKVGGDFTLLIHNSSLGNVDGWDGWKEMYELLLKELSKRKGV